MSYDIVLKRVYQTIEEDDGARVLVDRLWPRGRRREPLALADWYRDASPSPALRRQYHDNAISRNVFEIRYRGELRDHPEVLTPLMKLARQGRLTLLTATRSIDDSHLPILRDIVIDALQQEDQADALPSSPPCYGKGEEEQ
ncbi:hypothetical protein HCU01_37770 [Halomonas cupida]|uniref:Uncharacterized conserved protein YeaO, DUF488 family n=1 Tax=Halomonas cupida TaxID=44933 RepID=A0A1M7N0S2_9GAMM|nr:DUF488 family protein [Halomonas cupida]GEN25828.1 hypothetical protein HCU01_37770 [Halomonas cupida]SHM96527.1 Uncharacterized conserved protein YeaO, DUF488 family [Halomonas cupida]